LFLQTKEPELLQVRGLPVDRKGRRCLFICSRVFAPRKGSYAPWYLPFRGF